MSWLSTIITALVGAVAGSLATAVFQRRREDIAHERQKAAVNRARLISKYEQLIPAAHRLLHAALFDRTFHVMSHAGAAIPKAMLVDFGEAHSTAQKEYSSAFLVLRIEGSEDPVTKSAETFQHQVSAFAIGLKQPEGLADNEMMNRAYKSLETAIQTRMRELEKSVST